MAKQRTYKVLVGNYKPPDQDELVPAGKTFTVSGGGIPNEQILLDSGTLQIAKGSGSDEPDKTPCPRCEEEGMKRPPTFESHDELVAHYQEKHPALEPPAQEEVT